MHVVILNFCMFYHYIYFNSYFTIVYYSSNTFKKVDIDGVSLFRISVISSLKLTATSLDIYLTLTTLWANHWKFCDPFIIWHVLGDLFARSHPPLWSRPLYIYACEYRDHFSNRS